MLVQFLEAAVLWEYDSFSDLEIEREGGSVEAESGTPTIVAG
jgi:hypothetical protein